MATSTTFIPTDSSLVRQKALDLLDNFIRRGTLRGYGLGDSDQQQRFEEWVESPDTEPRIYVDPNKLDLREFRNPYAPVGPGEFLERDHFLLTNPRSPLTQSRGSDLAQGIPVGEDPNLPMDQDQFRDWVNRQRDLRDRPMRDALAPYGGSILELIRRNNLRGV